MKKKKENIETNSYYHENILDNKQWKNIDSFSILYNNNPNLVDLYVYILGPMYIY
jgi:hypothetical protein